MRNFSKYTKPQREGRPAGYTREVLTLSRGRYDEFLRAQPIEKISTVLLDTKTLKITGFVAHDTLPADVVSRFLSIDPLAAKYSYLSPYNFTANSPIFAIDFDGLEFFIVTTGGKKMTLGEFSTYIKTSKSVDIKDKLLYAALDALMNTKLGKEIIERYQNSKEVDVYVAAASTKIGGAITAKTLHWADKIDIIPESLDVEIGSQNDYDESDKFNNKPYAQSLTGMQVNVTRKNAFILIDPDHLNSQIFDDIDRAETLYHEIWAHIYLTADNLKKYIFETKRRIVDIINEVKKKSPNSTNEDIIARKEKKLISKTFPGEQQHEKYGKKDSGIGSSVDGRLKGEKPSKGSQAERIHNQLLILRK